MIVTFQHFVIGMCLLSLSSQNTIFEDKILIALS